MTMCRETGPRSRSRYAPRRMRTRGRAAADSSVRSEGRGARWRRTTTSHRHPGRAARYPVPLADAGDLGVRKKRKRRRKVQRTDTVTGAVVTEEVEEDVPEGEAATEPAIPVAVAKA